MQLCSNQQVCNLLSDCAEILQKHANGGQSGLFKIKPAGSEEVVEVYCDQGTGLGGWTLVQQGRMGLLTSIALGRSIEMVLAG